MAIKTLASASELIWRAGAHTESPIEVLFFQKIMTDPDFILMEKNETEPQGAGYFVYPQYEIHPYRVDFLIRVRTFRGVVKVWPPQYGFDFVVECDGAEFHSTPEQKAYDKKRDQYLLSKGYKTLRLTGSEIYKLDYLPIIKTYIRENLKWIGHESLSG